MDAPDDREERQLLDAVKKAVALTEGGTEPDDAVLKIARDSRLTPGQIRTVCYAYNTGRQTAQWKEAGTALDKLAGFPLADPEAVVARLYAAPTEKAAADADYSRPPDWLPDHDRLDRLRRPLPALEKVAACIEPAQRDDFAARRALGEVGRAKRAAEETGRLCSAAEDRLLAATARLVGYFRKAAAERLPFPAVEHAARLYFGAPVTVLFDHVHGRAKSREKRAADAPLTPGRIDLKREPFSLVADCLKEAAVVHRGRLDREAAWHKAEEVEARVLRPFGTATPAAEKAGVDDCSIIRGPLEARLEKESFFGSPAFGAAVGTIISRGLGNPVSTKDDLIEDDWLNLEDPAHQNEIRKIRAHAMLNQLLTDPEDPISGHDPDSVLSAYNEIAQLAPRAAEQPAVMRPLLRRRLMGNVEPFEAAEITNIEKGIAQAKMPTPNTATLGETPGKLQG